MTKQHKLPTRAEGIERLRTLYAVLAGVPAVYLNLRLIADIKDSPYTAEIPTVSMMVHRCGSTACSMGFAALYPEFVEQGLTMSGDESIFFHGKRGFDAAALFFSLTVDESLTLFASESGRIIVDKELHRQLHEGLHLGASHKRIALHRIRRFLELTDAITPERSAELAEIEKGY